MNELVNYKAVCKIAPAAPRLLILLVTENIMALTERGMGSMDFSTRMVRLIEKLNNELSKKGLPFTVQKKECINTLYVGRALVSICDTSLTREGGQAVMVTGGLLTY